MVDIKIVTGAGHHVYADKPDVFNRYVNETCDIYKVSSGHLPPAPASLQIPRDATESDEEHELPNLNTADSVEIKTDANVSEGAPTTTTEHHNEPTTTPTVNLADVKRK